MEKSYSITVNLQGTEFSTIQTGLANMAAAAVAANRAIQFALLPHPFEKEIYDLIAHFEKSTNEPYSFGSDITIRELTPIEHTPMLPLDMDNIGEELKKARIRARLSQRELKNRSGVPNPTICRIEKGHQRPAKRTIEKLMTAIAEASKEITL